MSMPPNNIDQRDGDRLLALYRSRRRYEVSTLDGYRPKHELVYDPFAKNMYQSISDDIDILSRTIGGRAKTRVRRECRERHIPYRGETQQLTI